MVMPELDNFLNDEKALEIRRQALIADVLKQREAFNKQIDERLAKLGYKNGANVPKRGRPKGSVKGKALKPAA